MFQHISEIAMSMRMRSGLPLLRRALFVESSSAAEGSVASTPVLSGSTFTKVSRISAAAFVKYTFCSVFLSYLIMYAAAPCQNDVSLQLAFLRGGGGFELKL